MQYIALEFDDHRILVATARVAAKRARIQQVFSVDIHQATAEQAAEKLRQALSENRASKGDAIVVVKRASVEIRELNLPPAPDNELPDMVRFMARSEFASLNDHWLLDFIPLSSDESAPRKVLASGLSPERQKHITRIVEGAGLKVKHILLRPFESYSLLLPVLSAGKRSLIVDLGDNQIDMIVSVDRRIVATRTVRVSSEDKESQVNSVLAEVKRTAVSAESTLGNRSIEEVILLGDTDIDDTVADGIRARLSIDVKIVKPFDLVDSDVKQKPAGEGAQYSALLGSLLQQAAGLRHSIDYLNPRRPIVKTDGRKKLMIYGGTAAGIALIVMIVAFWTLRTQSLEIAAQVSQLDQLIETNKGDKDRPGVEQILGEVRAIDEWKFADFNWLDELYEYSQRLLTPDDAIVDVFDGAIRDKAPSMTVKGRMANEIRSRLFTSLQSRPYQVTPIRWDVESDDPSYPEPYDFRVSFDVNQDELLKWLDQQAEDHFQKQRQERASLLAPTSEQMPNSPQ